MNHLQKLIHSYKVRIGLRKKKVEYFGKLGRKGLVKGYEAEISQYEAQVQRLTLLLKTEVQQ